MSYDLENASLFARFLRVKAIGGGAEFAQAQWGPQSRVAAMLLKSALSTLDLSTDADLRAASNGFLSLVRSRSLISKIAAVSGFARLPFETPILTQKTPLAASWTGESGIIPVTATSFDRAMLKQKKIAGLLPTTNELLKGAGANFESSLNRDLVSAVAELEGRSFITASNTGTGPCCTNEFPFFVGWVRERFLLRNERKNNSSRPPLMTENCFMQQRPGTADSPPSVTAGITPVSGSGDPKADIEKLLGAFTGDLESAVLITRPEAGVTLYNSGYLGTGAKGGDVAGLPHVTSSTTDVGMVALIDTTRILMADDGVTLDLSEQSTVLDENGKPVSLWQLNLSAIRAIRYLNWQALPGAVSVLSAPWA